MNALGLLLRVYLRGEINVFGDRLKILAGYITDQVSWDAQLFNIFSFSVFVFEKLDTSSLIT